MTSALKRLNDLDEAAKADRYPSVPAHARTPSNFTDASVAGLTRAILAWLELNGHPFTRINVFGRCTTGRDLEAVVHDARARNGLYIPQVILRDGTPDLVTVIHGRCVAIEVASPAGAGMKVKVLDPAYLVVRTFDQFLSWYDSRNRESNKVQSVADYRDRQSEETGKAWTKGK